MRTLREPRMIRNLIIVHILMVRCCSRSDSDKVKLIVKVTDEFRGYVDTVMNVYGFKFYRQIIDEIYTYANESPDNCTDSSIQQVHNLLDGKVEYIERSRNLYATVSPMEGMRLHYENPVDTPATYQVKGCPQTYVDIKEHWKHTGRGVVVAIVDSGIDDRDPVIRTKISKLFSYNFVDDINSNPSPSLSHGNVIANLIVGDHAHDETGPPCECGISPEITIADFKVGSWVATTQQHYGLMVDGETLSRGLAARQDVIDIYCNTWQLGQATVDVQSYITDILRQGVYKGRQGKGNIFVFPSGKPGNGFADNYTITVGWIESDETTVPDRVANSATLISVNTKTKSANHSKSSKRDQYKTTRQHELDVSSTATAIMSGIIALALQTNPNLTARDVKHLLVESATHKGLLEARDFQQNYAGYRYHKSIGFGYPDVNRMLELAQTWKDLAELQTFTIEIDTTWSRSPNRYILIGCEDSLNCNHRLEQLQMKVQTGFLKSSQEISVSIIAKSPKGTSSILFEETYMYGKKEGNQSIQMSFLSNHFWGEDPVGLWSIELNTSSKYHKPNSCYLNILEITLDTTGSNGKLTYIETASRWYIFAASFLVIVSIVLVVHVCYAKYNNNKNDKIDNSEEENMLPSTLVTGREGKYINTRTADWNGVMKFVPKRWSKMESLFQLCFHLLDFSWLWPEHRQDSLEAY